MNGRREGTEPSAASKTRSHSDLQMLCCPTVSADIGSKAFSQPAVWTVIAAEAEDPTPQP